jgi:hypothetical protein
MVLAEPRQHASVNLAVEIIHQERTKNRDVVLVRELIE